MLREKAVDSDRVDGQSSFFCLSFHVILSHEEESFRAKSLLCRLDRYPSSEKCRKVRRSFLVVLFEMANLDPGRTDCLIAAGMDLVIRHLCVLYFVLKYSWRKY